MKTRSDAFHKIRKALTLDREEDGAPALEFTEHCWGFNVPGYGEIRHAPDEGSLDIFHVHFDGDYMPDIASRIADELTTI